MFSVFAAFSEIGNGPEPSQVAPRAGPRGVRCGFAGRGLRGARGLSLGCLPAAFSVCLGCHFVFAGILLFFLTKHFGDFNPWWSQARHRELPGPAGPAGGGCSGHRRDADAGGRQEGPHPEIPERAAQDSPD